MNLEHNLPQDLNRRARWEFSGKGTAIASAAATLLLNAGVGLLRDDGLPNVSFNLGQREVGEVTYERVASGEGTPKVQNITVQRRTSPPQVDKIEELIQGKEGDTEWARKFSEDPEATRANEQAAKEIYDLISSLHDSGAKNIQVSFTGFASAEDDTPSDVDGGNAGLQTFNQKIVELADVRRDSLILKVESLGAIPEDVKFVKLEGTDPALTNDQMDVLSGLKDQFGYDSVKTMVEQWNRTPEDVPPIVKSILGAYLGNDDQLHRGATALVTADVINQQTAGEVKYETVNSWRVVCAVPVIEQEIHTQAPNRHSVPYPIPALIPVFIRRRRSTRDPREELGNSLLDYYKMTTSSRGVMYREPGSSQQKPKVSESVEGSKELVTQETDDRNGKYAPKNSEVEQMPKLEEGTELTNPRDLARERRAADTRLLKDLFRSFEFNGIGGAIALLLLGLAGAGIGLVDCSGSGDNTNNNTPSGSGNPVIKEVCPATAEKVEIIVGTEKVVVYLDEHGQPVDKKVEKS